MITTNQAQLRPVIFAGNVAKTGEFLAALGLAPMAAADGDGWLEFAARRGAVAVHDAATSTVGAAPGQVLLSFQLAEAAPAAARVRAAGLSASILDESYGRALVITLPDGMQLIADAETEDRYGYRALLGGVDLPGGVAQVAMIQARWPVGDPGAAARVLDALLVDDAVQLAPSEEAPTTLRGLDGQARPAAAVSLLLRSDEPLPAVADRAATSGYPFDRAQTQLRITGPDQLVVLIRPADPAAN